MSTTTPPPMIQIIITMIQIIITANRRQGGGTLIKSFCQCICANVCRMVVPSFIILQTAIKQRCIYFSWIDDLATRYAKAYLTQQLFTNHPGGQSLVSSIFILWERVRFQSDVEKSSNFGRVVEIKDIRPAAFYPSHDQSLGTTQGLFSSRLPWIHCFGFRRVSFSW